jgi:acyl-CoA thioester hydrolase
MDMLGHLNQAVYHELLEEARGALIDSLEGVDGFPFVLARVELDYRREVRRRDGSVELVARVGSVGRTSVTVEHEVLVDGGAVAASGRAILVAWDVDSRGPRALTEPERAALEG